MDDVWVIVPMFNEATKVGDIVSELRTHFLHVLCVDDGSSDGSAEVAAEAGAHVLRHVVNLGQGAALETGFEYLRKHTSAEYVVTFDADGQHRVHDALRMVEAAKQGGHDVVLASRFLNGHTHMPTGRRLVLRSAVTFTRLTTRLPVTDAHNGLRVLNRRALELLRLGMPGMAHASEILGLIARCRLRHCEIPTTILYSEYSRTKGQSNLNSLNIVFDLAVAKIRSP